MLPMTSVDRHTLVEMNVEFPNKGAIQSLVLSVILRLGFVPNWVLERLESGRIEGVIQMIQMIQKIHPVAFVPGMVTTGT